MVLEDQLLWSIYTFERLATRGWPLLATERRQQVAFLEVIRTETERDGWKGGRRQRAVGGDQTQRMHAHAHVASMAGHDRQADGRE